MSSSNAKRFLVPAGLVVGGVTLGSLLAPIGLASADDTDTGTTETESTEAESTESTESTENDADGHRHGRRGHRGLKAEALEEILGLSAEEIRDGMAEGKSLADLAAEQGVSNEELTAAMAEAASERLDQAVEDGKLTAEEAEERLAEMDDRIAEMITRVPPEGFGEGRGEGHGHGRGGRMGPFHGGVEVLEETLGLTSEEIKAGLDEGKTLADLAEEQGVSVDDVADALVAQATERIDEAVANGKIDEDGAAQAKENLEEMIDNAIEAEPFNLGRGVGRAENRGLRFHHRNGHHGDQGVDADAPTDTAVEADA